MQRRGRENKVIDERPGRVAVLYLAGAGYVDLDRGISPSKGLTPPTLRVEVAPMEGVSSQKVDETRVALRESSRP